MTLREYLKANLLRLDGGMGTLLQAAGLPVGVAPEKWNETHPDVVTKIHLDYLLAGANVISANTFGLNTLSFSKDDAERLVFAAVRNARKAIASLSRQENRFVALDIGPTGRMLAPYGDLSFEDAVSVFKETVALGVKAGVDLVFIETMNDIYETKAALLAVKETTDLPVFVSNAYGVDGRLMTGASPAAMVALLEGMGADAIGVNCSLGPKALAPTVKEYLRYASIPVLAKPNAGLPRVENGRTVYDVSPDEFAAEVASLVDLGVRSIGGCCGTTPAHIAALTEKTKDRSPLPIEEKTDTLVSSYTHAVAFGDLPVLIGERINPTGKKRFKEALLARDIGYILNEGLSEEKAGAEILDVNVGLPDIDEAALLTETVRELQAVTALPLQIDTANPDAMEAALRIYNGKALINSANGKKETMDKIFPLARKYGGTVIALTLDESGIPDAAEARVAIAERIMETATAYGIKKKDIIFDPLALTVSADKNAAAVTLQTVKMLTERGYRTSLGVSNVSFGLPQRDAVNASFFLLAAENGLSAAIINPYSVDMMRAYRTLAALKGKDESCAQYIAFAERLVSPTLDEKKDNGKSNAKAESLGTAIEKGLRALAGEKAKELLNTLLPMEILQNEVIPALDRVGVGFERKTVYLPQLLMSAEAAAAAFEAVKEALPSKDKEKGKPFVLATVKGDIHDIGKNIVRLLLENYGFHVYDLGRDVPPEKVVAAVGETGARVVGLSALMTTTVPAMEKTVRLLHKEFPAVKVVVGGAVLNREYAERIGADAYAADAMETVRYAEEIYSKM